MVCEGLEAFLRSRGSGVILAYRAFKSEVQLEPLALKMPDVAWLTTRVDPGGRLTLHAFSRAVVTNRFGVLEPPPDAPEFDPSSVEAALVPGLVFDVSGVRIGYGAGFYDRFLPRLPPGIPIVGVTCDALVVDELPSDPHDVRVSHIATESGVRAI